MKSIITEVFNEAFNLDDFFEICHAFRQETEIDPIKQRKQYRKSFVKYKPYRKFRKKFRKKITISAGVLSFLVILYHNVVVDMLSKSYTVSGFILLISVFLLVICCSLTVLFLAVMTINSFNATTYDKDTRSFNISFVVTAYFLFMAVYFTYFENLLIDIMFKVDDTSSYKISSILEMIRNILVFSGSGMLFAWVSNNFKSIAKEQGKNKEQNCD